MLGGGAAFAVFSGVIDLYMRKAPAERVIPVSLGEELDFSADSLCREI